MTTAIDAFRSSLEALRSYLQSEKQQKHKRRVSFGDLVTDRWQNARDLGWGEGASCYDNVLVLGDVRVGRHTWIGPNVILDGAAEGGLQIGEYCTIGAGVQIYTHDSVKWAISGGKHPYERAPTRIGDHCFIGPQAVIAKGVTIGNRVIVGAMSFVNKDVPDGTKVMGCPARPIA